MYADIPGPLEVVSADGVVTVVDEIAARVEDEAAPSASGSPAATRTMSLPPWFVMAHLENNGKKFV